MTLDTTDLLIVRTKDNYFRYVCHKQRILTVGFGSPVGLQRNASGFLNSETAIHEMRNRYEQEYATTMATIPTVTEKLVIELQDAIDSLQYLRPEKFDNALHESTWDERLERKKTLVAQSKKLLHVAPRKADTADNARRVRSASQSIKQYDPKTEGIKTAMVDCLTNLMHLASSEGIAFNACLDLARTHFNEE